LESIRIFSIAKFRSLVSLAISFLLSVLRLSSCTKRKMFVAARRISTPTSTGVFQLGLEGGGII
jgi:hypothetical protein